MLDIEDAIRWYLMWYLDMDEETAINFASNFTVDVSNNFFEDLAVECDDKDHPEHADQE